MGGRGGRRVGRERRGGRIRIRAGKAAGEVRARAGYGRAWLGQ